MFLDAFLRGFPSEESLAHVTALWQFPVMFYLPHHQTTDMLGPEHARIKLFCWAFVNLEKDHPWGCESSGYWYFK